MMNKFDVAIVGGGIAGIFAALYLSKRGQAVCLIEAEKEIGGLLKSFKNEVGESFDYGTHFIGQTGLSEIDSLLLNDKSSWSAFATLKVSTFLEGKTNTSSSYIKPTHLSPEIYAKALEDFFLCKPGLPTTNLKEYYINRFGSTFTSELFEPIFNKLYKTALERISINAARTFQLQRLIVLTPEESRRLKTDPWIDERLAFHDAKEGAPPLSTYYPPADGIGTWIDGLKLDLKKHSVQVLTNAIVSKISKKQKTIHSLELKSGETIEANKFIWTIPPKFAADLMGLQVPAKPPEFVRTGIHMLTLNTRPQTDSYYVTNYDRNHQTYRATLFDNFSTNVHSGRYRVCVESFCSKNETPADTQGILNELKAAGIFSRETEVLYAHTINLPAGFPIMTNEFFATMDNFVKTINENTDNMILCGKASGKSFFMTDTLIETLSSIRKIVD